MRGQALHGKPVDKLESDGTADLIELIVDTVLIC